jgi:hypothetical protein
MYKKKSIQKLNTKQNIIFYKKNSIKKKAWKSCRLDHETKIN